MPYEIHTLSETDSQYQLVFGQCNSAGCDNCATHQLYNEKHKPIPGGRHCTGCADEIIREYSEKLGWHWTAETLMLWSVDGVLFENYEHTEEYMREQKEQQEMTK